MKCAKVDLYQCNVCFKKNLHYYQQGRNRIQVVWLLIFYFLFVLWEISFDWFWFTCHFEMFLMNQFKTVSICNKSIKWCCYCIYCWIELRECRCFELHFPTLLVESVNKTFPSILELDLFLMYSSIVKCIHYWRWVKGKFFNHFLSMSFYRFDCFDYLYVKLHFKIFHCLDFVLEKK